VAAAEPALPATDLRPDTRVALAASDPTRPYLGVWATDAAACASVDQPGATGYAVITGISIRQGTDLTLVDAAPLTDGKATLGEVELTLSAPDTLTLGGTTMTRCTAP
jgi:hypothetical protein